jgi:hypothetical protein
VEESLLYQFLLQQEPVKAKELLDTHRKEIADLGKPFMELSNFYIAQKERDSILARFQKDKDPFLTNVKVLSNSN